MDAQRERTMETVKGEMVAAIQGTDDTFLTMVDAVIKRLTTRCHWSRGDIAEFETVLATPAQLTVALA